MLIPSAVAVIMLDQASKALVIRRGRRSRIPGPIGVIPVRNPRGSLFAVSERQARWLIAVATIYVAALVALISPLGTAAAAGLGVSIGGAVSNLADRTWRGAVIDFIAVGRWPTFNVADAALVAGLVLVGWAVV